MLLSVIDHYSLCFFHVKVFVHSDCMGDLVVTSTSTGEQSTFAPTQFRTLTAGWGSECPVRVICVSLLPLL